MDALSLPFRSVRFVLKVSSEVLNFQISLLALLCDQNPDDPQDPAVASIFKQDRHRYEEICREWVRRYAMQS